jgi:hypothetical protein
VQRTPNEPFLALDLVCAARTVSYRASDRQWPDSTWRLEHITSAPPLPSTVLASAGKNPEAKAHRAARSEDIPSRLSLPVAVSDHGPTAAPRSLYGLNFVKMFDWPMKRPSHRIAEDYLIISSRLFEKSAALLPAISCFVIDSAVVHLDYRLSWRWVPLVSLSSAEVHACLFLI